MDLEWLQIGGIIGGVVAVVFIFREITAFVKPWIDRKAGGVEQEPSARTRCVPDDVNLRRMAAQIEDLHEWHDKTDEDGAPVWYVRSSMTRIVEKLADNQTQMAKVLERLAIREELTGDAVARIEKRLQHLDYDHKEIL